MKEKDWVAENIAELGEILSLDEVLPGVYTLTVKSGKVGVEYYVTTKDSPVISEEAQAYGQAFAKCPDLRFYKREEPKSGWSVIDFEVQRYQRKHHLLPDEPTDSIHTTAIYGMEDYPEYFGTYPVPMVTPRGYTIRHKTILNGVYWLETDRCEELLAVCYPIWQADIPIPEQALGEHTEYDRLMGVNETHGYLFFPKKDSCVPLYELYLLHPEIADNGVLLPALRNAVSNFYPEYAARRNEEEADSDQWHPIENSPGVGSEFIRF